MEEAPYEAYEEPLVDDRSAVVADQERRADSDTEYAPEAVRPPARFDCQAHLNACLETPLADQPGNVSGERRCVSCFNFCRGQGQWPDQIAGPRGQGMTCQRWRY